jgi:putative DNA primase/helicase
MRWPPEELPDSVRKRILALWTLANQATNLGERANALAALGRLQLNHDLSDVELNYLAEYEAKEPVGLRDQPDRVLERPANILEIVLHLIPLNHIILRFEQAFTVATWILHCPVFEKFIHTPRLTLMSDEPGCGKSLLMNLIKLLTDDARLYFHATPAAIYRRLRRKRTVFLLDEVEHGLIWNNLLFRALIDAGHREGSSALITGPDGEDVEYPVQQFPLALALVAKTPVYPQLLSRSIALYMVKHPDGRDETVTASNSRLIATRQLIRAWSSTFERPSEVSFPKGMAGRDVDNWRCLAEIATVLGYPNTMRAVIRAMHRPSDNPVIRLLLDIYQVFQQRDIDRVWTTELLKALHDLPDRPWDEYRGSDRSKEPHKLTRGELYDLLKTKGIRSKTIWKRIGDERGDDKGFMKEQFAEAWAEIGATPPQSSKIISLPRHSKGHSGGTVDSP